MVLRTIKNRITINLWNNSTLTSKIKCTILFLQEKFMLCLNEMCKKSKNLISLESVTERFKAIHAFI